MTFSQEQKEKYEAQLSAPIEVIELASGESDSPCTPRTPCVTCTSIKLEGRLLSNCYQIIQTCEYDQSFSNKILCPSLGSRMKFKTLFMKDDIGRL